MTFDEAAEKLARCHEQAPGGKKVTAIHVFGIVFADQIDGMPLPALAEAAGLSKSYGVELNKAMNISQYVTVHSRPWD